MGVDSWCIRQVRPYDALRFALLDYLYGPCNTIHRRNAKCTSRMTRSRSLPPRSWFDELTTNGKGDAHILRKAATTGLRLRSRLTRQSSSRRTDLRLSSTADA